MTPAALKALLEQVSAGAVTARTAQRLLVETYGWDPDDAEETVFIELGGGDVVETGPDGIDYYPHSGRTVAEVEADMER